MSQDVVIRVDGLSKSYRLGQIHHDLLAERISACLAWMGRSAARLARRRSGQAGESGSEPAGMLSRRPARGQTDSIWALKDVHFEVRRGEVVGLIGRNGAGKSTLLKILTGVTEPTEGQAWLKGRIGSLLEVGTGFHPELTGRENIYMNGAVLGMRRAEISRKFDEIVDFAGVERFIDTPVKRYSSGMYVRLAFAVAAHLDPEILLVDEVLAVGDAAFQRKCLGRMGEIAHEGRTVIFVSHNMFSLRNLCSRGILLEGGRLTMDGDMQEVITHYLNLGGKPAGEVRWESPETAPGGERVRLRAVRILVNGEVTDEVDIDKDFDIEIEYWNLAPNEHRTVSFHLYNAMGVCVLTSANFPSACVRPDPWQSRSYPAGVFRTSCTIPGKLLNNGLYTISAYVVGPGIHDVAAEAKDALTFSIRDTGFMRGEFTGEWLGAIRVQLDWRTQPCGDA